MNSVAILSDPLAYVTCELYTHLFFIFRLCSDTFGMVHFPTKTHFPCLNCDAWVG